MYYENTQNVAVYSFMGRFGFYLRKTFPALCGKAYLAYQRVSMNRYYKKAIANIMRCEFIVPFQIFIETINRCNGMCPFCPCNKYEDKRQLKKMSEELFIKIIDELARNDYCGILMLSGNCEPFLDDRITRFINIAYERLPKAQKLLYTNGSLLTKEKMAEIAGKLDILHINNYSKEYKLIAPIQEVYNYVKTHAASFGDMRVKIELRYANEVLSNKGGTAPNNKNYRKVYKHACLHPYMDAFIFPDGVVGLCCNDNSEVTNFGDVNDENLYDIFNGKKLQAVRVAIKDGRNGYNFCKYCDFMSIPGRRKRWIETGRD